MKSDSKGMATVEGKRVVVDTEKYMNYWKNYRHTHRVNLRKYHRVYNREYRKKHGYQNETNSQARYPEKHKARIMLQKAIHSGSIKRGICQKCNKKNAQAHHNDYSKPLEVIWVCPLHHTELHKRT